MVSGRFGEWVMLSGIHPDPLTPTKPLFHLFYHEQRMCLVTWQAQRHCHFHLLSTDCCKTHQKKKKKEASAINILLSHQSDWVPKINKKKNAKKLGVRVNLKRNKRKEKNQSRLLKQYRSYVWIMK